LWLWLDHGEPESPDLEIAPLDSLPALRQRAALAGDRAMTADAFQPGQPILWNPPRQAYGPKSMQTLAAGQVGTVRRVWNDHYLLADIGDWRDVLLHVDFVEPAR